MDKTHSHHFETRGKPSCVGIFGEIESFQGFFCRISSIHSIGVVVGGNNWNKSVVFFPCLGPHFYNSVHYPINYASLCTRVGIPLLLLKMHCPETPSFFDLRGFAGLWRALLFGCGVFRCQSSPKDTITLNSEELILIQVNDSDSGYFRIGSSNQ